MRTPSHVFHGYATGFGARIEVPLVEQAAEASTALSPIGGGANAVSRDRQLQDLFEYQEARSSVLGHYFDNPNGVVTAETRVSASVTGLVIPGVLSVDRVSLAMRSERDFRDGQPDASPRRFHVDEVRIECLRSPAQANGEPVFNNGECFDFDASENPAGVWQRLCRGVTEQALFGELNRPLADGTEGVFVSHHPDVDRRICGHRDVRPPVFSVVRGDMTFDIFLLELLCRHGQLDLAMLRVEARSNPRGGSMVAAAGGINGSPST